MIQDPTSVWPNLANSRHFGKKVKIFRKHQYKGVLKDENKEREAGNYPFFKKDESLVLIQRNVSVTFWFSREVPISLLQNCCCYYCCCHYCCCCCCCWCCCCWCLCCWYCCCCWCRLLLFWCWCCCCWYWCCWYCCCCWCRLLLLLLLLVLLLLLLLLCFYYTLSPVAQSGHIIGVLQKVPQDGQTSYLLLSSRWRCKTWREMKHSFKVLMVNLTPLELVGRILQMLAVANSTLQP